MKLLLTSNGLANDTIAKAAVALVGKPASETNVLFIPTAANVEPGDKGWLIDDLYRIKQQGYAKVDIIDIAAVAKDVSLARMQDADFICFGGGVEEYLSQVLTSTGLREELPELFKTRVYMGISAGSMIAGIFLPEAQHQIVYPHVTFDPTAHGLDFVNLYFIPHLNSPEFANKKRENIERVSNLPHPLYALDDGSALKIVDGHIEVIGEGEHVVVEAK